MNKPEPYTLEYLEFRQKLLKKKISLKEDSIKRNAEELFLAPTLEGRFDQMLNYAKAGFNIYDGFRTGYKLLKSFGLSFRKKKK